MEKTVGLGKDNSDEKSKESTLGSEGQPVNVSVENSEESLKRVTVNVDQKAYPSPIPYIRKAT